MAYLNLRVSEGEWSDYPTHSEYPIASGEFFNYPLTREAKAILLEWWYSTPNVKMIYDGLSDPVVSGILADYLQDHRDELLQGATGPTDPAVRLDALIEYLRARFHSSC